MPPVGHSSCPVCLFLPSLGGRPLSPLGPVPGLGHAASGGVPSASSRRKSLSSFRSSYSAVKVLSCLSCSLPSVCRPSCLWTLPGDNRVEVGGSYRLWWAYSESNAAQHNANGVTAHSLSVGVYTPVWCCLVFLYSHTPSFFSFLSYLPAWPFEDEAAPDSCFSSGAAFARVLRWVSIRYSSDRPIPGRVP